MSWFAWSLAAGLTSALNVGASKFLVGSGLQPVVLGGVVHLSGGLLCLLALPFTDPRAGWSAGVLLGVLGMGAVYTLGNVLYFLALRATPLSEIDLFLRTSSLWTFVGGVVLLGEPLGASSGLGAGLVVASVLVLSQQTPSRLRFTRAQLLALAAALTFGLGNVIDKSLSPYFDPATYSALNLLLTGAGMLAAARPRLSELAQPVLWGAWAWVVAATFALTQALLILAYQSGGGAGEVILVAQARLLLLVAAGVVLLGERDRLGRKLLAVGLMVAGISLLYRG
ncbi:DMT family transporter [Calidithermus chliarophilus]|uniref:DMT family transporter n=1 Tax=Calidithermus chliarophilus TaxID=52023 RepID=UPI000485B0AA|nr:DMT family transporter [Calidithermus chliarophilus]